MDHWPVAQWSSAAENRLYFLSHVGGVKQPSRASLVLFLARLHIDRSVQLRMDVLFRCGWMGVSGVGVGVDVGVGVGVRGWVWTWVCSKSR